MADRPSPAVLPFRALRYTASAGDPACLLAPPYDVISAAARAALAAESPHNVVHVELPGGDPGDERVRRTRDTMRAWRTAGLLARDPRPAFYLHEQVFAFEGTRTRRGFFALVRLPEPGERLVLPHEATLAGPLQERKALLAALGVQTSPILLTYRSRGELPSPPRPPEQRVVNHGEEHRLWRIESGADVAAITATIDGPLYIADGHHRYATALALRDEVRSRAAQWRGDEPEALVMAELVPVGGMTVLAWHRLVKPGLVPADLATRLERFFAVETVPPASLHARLAAAGRTGTAFGVLAGAAAGGARLLTVRDATALARSMPQDRSNSWRSLDVAVLEHTVIRQALGLDAAEIKAGALRYTYDAREAAAEVEAGRAALAILLNPTPLEQVMAVADDGELMPQKSTCFHPKLPTGLVLYAHGDVEEEEEARP